MSTQKPSLAAALHDVSEQKKPSRRAKAPATRPKPKEKKGEKTPYLPPSRQGKKAITGFFDHAVARQLKQIALDEETTGQALLAEALNDLFKKYKRKPIA